MRRSDPNTDTDTCTATTSPSPSSCIGTGIISKYALVSISKFLLLLLLLNS